MIAMLIALALTAYAAFGVLFATAFVGAGITRVDPGTAGTSLGFRLLILPGVAALWPIMARRLFKGARS